MSAEKRSHRGGLLGDDAEGSAFSVTSEPESASWLAIVLTVAPLLRRRRSGTEV